MTPAELDHRLRAAEAVVREAGRLAHPFRDIAEGARIVREQRLSDQRLGRVDLMLKLFID